MLKGWRSYLLGTFAAGIFVVLPIALTVAVIGWLVGQIETLLGPQTAIGGLLSYSGQRLLGSDHESLAFWLGVLLAVGGIWLLGLVVRIATRRRIEGLIERFVERVPVVRSIYGPISQVVGLLSRADDEQLKQMQVVMCRFGEGSSASVLALLTSRRTYRIDGRAMRLVYLPTSPLPMSGALTFVPVESVTAVEGLNVDGLMQIYLSLGTLSEQVLPREWQVGD